jgi:hypothetical protein
MCLHVVQPNELQERKMNTTPAFGFSKSLAPRLTAGAAISQAQLVMTTHETDVDARLVEHSPMEVVNIINRGGCAAFFLVEWPDGSMARAYLPVGGQVLEGMRSALLDAYGRGRQRLEQIHLEMAAHQGQA